MPRTIKAYVYDNHNLGALTSEGKVKLFHMKDGQAYASIKGGIRKVVTCPDGKVLPPPAKMTKKQRVRQRRIAKGCAELNNAIQENFNARK